MPRFKIPNGVKLFALVWLLIMVLPPTREIFRSYFSSLTPILSATPSLKQKITPQLHQQFPVQAGMWLSDQEYYSGDRQNAFKRLDTLRQRFPQHLEVSALEIQLLCSGIDYRNKAKSDSALMQKAANIAYEAGQREPQNVFWPMMESGFYFRANQKVGAIQALKRAKVGTKYDDYSQQIIKERIHFYEQQGSIVWERKIALWASALYPQLGQFREASKLATQEAAVAKKRGDDKRVIEIIASILKASGLLMRDGQVVIANLVGESIARDSLDELFDTKGWRSSTPIEERTKFQKTLVRKWANYSRESGKSEAVNYANFLNEESITTKVSGLWSNDTYEWIGLPAPYGFIALTGTPLLVWVAMLSLGCGFIWLLNGLFFVRSNHDAETAPPRGSVTSCVSFSFWATVGLVAIAIKMHWLNLASNFVGAESSYIFPILMPPLLAVIWLLPVYFQLQKRKFRLVQQSPTLEPKREITKLSPKNNNLRKIAWITSFLMLGLLYWSFNGLDSLVVSALCTSIAILSFVVAIRFEIINQKSKRRVIRRFRLEKIGSPKPTASLKLRLARLGLWGSFLLFTVMLVAQSSWPSTLPDLILMGAFGLACLGGAIWFETRNGNTQFALARRLACQSAGVLGIVWSLFLVMGSFGIWPLRAELNTQLEHRLQMSELDWMKEMAEKNRQNSPEENSGG